MDKHMYKRIYTLRSVVFVDFAQVSRTNMEA